jgi:hypothetical protein
MLDYYGSILFEEDDIKKDIMNYYKQLNQDRIQECFQELKEEGHILKQYSISGWNVFHRKEVIKEKQELDCSYLRLWFTQVSIRGDLPYEPSIVTNICHYYNRILQGLIE